MKTRELAFERRKEIGVIRKGKFAVQPADDVKLGRTFGDGGTGDLDAFLDRVGVCIFLPRSSIKSAKLAVRYADVRVVEVPVYVVIRRQAVFPAAHGVGQLA